jgi:hypothetical protein
MVRVQVARVLERFPLALNHSVMAGHSPSKTGVNALMPGHPRLSSLRHRRGCPARACSRAGQQAGPGWPGMTEHMGQVEREPL